MNHPRLLQGSALTILRAYCLAGRPAFGLRPWGSFQEWSDLVRNAVYWVLGVDCDTREPLAERADSTRAAHTALVQVLQEQFGLNPFTSEQILELYVSREARLALLIETIDDLNVNPKGLSSRSLGRILLRAIGAVHGGLRLDLQPTATAPVEDSTVHASSPRSAGDYLLPKVQGWTEERFRMLTLNAKGDLLADRVLAHCTATAGLISPPRVLPGSSPIRGHLCPGLAQPSLRRSHAIPGGLRSHKPPPLCEREPWGSPCGSRGCGPRDLAQLPGRERVGPG